MRYKINNGCPGRFGDNKWSLLDIWMNEWLWVLYFFKVIPSPLADTAEKDKFSYTNSNQKYRMKVFYLRRCRWPPPPLSVQPPCRDLWLGWCSCCPSLPSPQPSSRPSRCSPKAGMRPASGPLMCLFWGPRWTLIWNKSLAQVSDPGGKKITGCLVHCWIRFQQVWIEIIPVGACDLILHRLSWVAEIKEMLNVHHSLWWRGYNTIGEDVIPTSCRLSTVLRTVYSAFFSPSCTRVTA